MPIFECLYAFENIALHFFRPRPTVRHGAAFQSARQSVVAYFGYVLVSAINQKDNGIYVISNIDSDKFEQHNLRALRNFQFRFGAK